MAGFENERNKELETAKLELQNTKHMRSEVQNKINQLQEDRETGCLQHQKRMKSLSNIEANQSLKLSKLDSDIATLEQVLNSRLTEHKVLHRLIEDNEKAIKSTKEETDTMVSDFLNKCHELEDTIKEGYLHIQTDEDMKVLLEVAHNVFKDNNKLPYLLDTLCDKREAIFNRRQEISKQLSLIESAQAALCAEIKTKQEDLAAANKLHSTLAARCATLRKLKKSDPPATNPCVPVPVPVPAPKP